MRQANTQELLEYIKECFDLNYNTGELLWKVRPRSHFLTDEEWWLYSEHFPGTLVKATAVRGGYLRVVLQVEGVKWRLQVHRLVFALANNRWPISTIDHRNRHPTDNRPDNLFDATMSEQMQNAVFKLGKSGYRGVSRTRRGWRARIKIDGKLYTKGPFKEIERAIEAYASLKAKHHRYQPIAPDDRSSASHSGRPIHDGSLP